MKSTGSATLAVITVALALPLAYAGAASADVPEGWSDPDDVYFLHALLVLVGIPLAGDRAAGAGVYVPSIVRGESVAPAGARADDEWFGGRGDTTKALESGKSRTPTPRRVGPVAAGDFSAGERFEIDRAIRAAEQTSRFEFSVFVGHADGEPRAYAEGLHAALVAPRTPCS